ncbi:MAG: hypothetical protein FK734_07995 [Asgard group archaeon]|nr:hypothetical protein [Asgard group archaeon]
MNLSYTFDDSIDKEKDVFFDYTKSLRPLTGKVMFCPKCGSRNLFKEKASGVELNYFCKNCSVRLNDFWKDVENGHRALTHCENCYQLTFNRMIYCIHCGTKQQRIAGRSSKQLSKELDKKRRDSDVGNIVDSIVSSDWPICCSLCSCVPFLFLGIFGFLIHSFIRIRRKLDK